MQLNPSSPNIPIQRHEHRHDEITTPELAESLGEAAAKLGEGFRVIPLAEGLERTVHHKLAITESKGVITKALLEPDETHIAIVSKGDTGPLYQEANRIMDNRRPPT